MTSPSPRTRRLLRVFTILAAILFWPALALVVWGELTPNSLEPAPGYDKVLHFIAYFGLAGLAATPFVRRRPALIAVLLLIAAGGLLEIIQGYTGRDPSFWDEAANTAGAITGGLLARLIVEPWRRRIASKNEKNSDL
jgi:VanZ family protein